MFLADGKHNNHQTDPGCRGRKRYSLTWPPVQWHFGYYVHMDMMSLQVICWFKTLYVKAGSLISSDCGAVPLAQFTEGDQSFKLGKDFKDMGAALELFRASEMIIHPDEVVLEKHNSWSRHFLEHGLSSGSIHADRLEKYVAQEVTPHWMFGTFFSKHFGSRTSILRCQKFSHPLRLEWESFSIILVKNICFLLF